MVVYFYMALFQNSTKQRNINNYILVGALASSASFQQFYLIIALTMKIRLNAEYFPCWRKNASKSKIELKFSPL